jgi:hypothetical protein
MSVISRAVATAATAALGVVVVVGVVGVVGAQSAQAAPAVHHFQNCTDMHRVYPHGVGRVHAHDHTASGTDPVTNFKRSNALYAANSSMDRDHDHVACEEH